MSAQVSVCRSLIIKPAVKAASSRSAARRVGSSGVLIELPTTAVLAATSLMLAPTATRMDSLPGRLSGAGVRRSGTPWIRPCSRVVRAGAGGSAAAASTFLAKPVAAGRNGSATEETTPGPNRPALALPLRSEASWE